MLSLICDFQRFRTCIAYLLLQEKWHYTVVSTEEIILLIHFYKRCDLANAPSRGVILLGTSTREVLIYLRSLQRGLPSKLSLHVGLELSWPPSI